MKKIKNVNKGDLFKRKDNNTVYVLGAEVAKDFTNERIYSFTEFNNPESEAFEIGENEEVVSDFSPSLTGEKEATEIAKSALVDDLETYIFSLCETVVLSKGDLLNIVSKYF